MDCRIELILFALFAAALLIIFFGFAADSSPVDLIQELAAR
jgi:hypothetical protein